MRQSEKFSLTKYGVRGKYSLKQQIEHNGKPAVIIGITEDSLMSDSTTTLECIYGRNEGGMICGLTCEELGEHDWQRFTSLYGKNHGRACHYCGKYEDTGEPVTDDDRAAGLAELEMWKARLGVSDEAEG